MNASPVSPPGVRSPAVGFEQPFEMLQACHERVQRSLDLLQRLIAHVDQNGCDADARSAAADVQRYFDVAGPHHHEDEERHVFPLLADDPSARLRQTVVLLENDHLLMNAIWQRLRPALQRWQGDADNGPMTELERTFASDFTQAYQRHIALEEGVLYPAARALLSADDLREMGNEMAARRRRD
ncbi:MAG: hemerythrin domain-containing protein [Ottowia sp.]|nr:hemerythrin domain-containing protein [Ottowia sp.]